MKLILIDDVKKLGKKGEIVEVSDGYGRNYLVKNKLAVEVSKKSLEVLQEQKAQDKANEEQKEKEANELKDKLEQICLEFTTKVGKDGRTFGSVSSKHVMEELYKKHAISLDKRKLIDSDTINSLGYYNLKIDLYKNKVIGTIKVHVSEK